MIAISAIWLLVFIYPDYIRSGLNSQFYLMTTLRLILISFSIFLYIYLPKELNTNVVDYSILSYGILFILLGIFNNTLLASASFEIITINHLLILSFYLILPNRLQFKVISAVFASMMSFYIVIKHASDFTQTSIMSHIFMVIIMNIIGLLVAFRIDSQRYHQHLIQKTFMAGREQLLLLARTDSLTGVLNRRGFLEMSEIEFDRYKRYGEVFSFAMIDFDKLKLINDTHGHPAGDLSLQKLVEVIDRQKRSTDMLGRLSGDEFGLLLPHTNTDKAIEVLNRCKKALETEKIKQSDATMLQVQFSAGVTEINVTDEFFDEIYKRADAALLSAKKNGRNKNITG